jgi:hypothetical protein
MNPDLSLSDRMSRYQQRRDYEEAEANAIGTEYLRADLLHTADAAKVRELLRDYRAQSLCDTNVKSFAREALFPCANAV